MKKSVFFVISSVAAMACYGIWRYLKPRPALPAFRTVNPAHILAGGQPTDAGLRRLAESGVRTILDLRRGLLTANSPVIRHKARSAEHLGLKFLHLPMHRFTGPTPAQLDQAVTILVAPEVYPLYVHCDDGIERTNIVIGVYRVRVLGWSREAAFAEMRREGFKKIYTFWWWRYWDAKWTASQHSYSPSHL